MIKHANILPVTSTFFMTLITGNIEFPLPFPVLIFDHLCQIFLINTRQCM